MNAEDPAKNTVKIIVIAIVDNHWRLTSQVRRVGAKPPVEREPYSLYVCGLKNPVRKRLIEIVEHKLFEVRIVTFEHIWSVKVCLNRKWKWLSVHSSHAVFFIIHYLHESPSPCARSPPSPCARPPWPGLHPDGDLRHLPLSRRLPADPKQRHHCCQWVPSKSSSASLLRMMIILLIY